jgi:hypothetical protein
MSQILIALNSLMGLVLVFIAALGIKLSRQQARDSWLRTYKELHETFWSEPDFQEVRAWLANEVTYATVKPVLKKRQAMANNQEACSLPLEEYEVLEKLDKFLNFLLAVIIINPEFKKRVDLWQNLYFDYWLKKFGDSNRPELGWYLKEFYRELHEMIGRSLHQSASV